MVRALGRTNGMQVRIAKSLSIVCLLLIATLPTACRLDPERQQIKRIDTLVSGTRAGIERNVFEQVNDYRSSRGLVPLSWDSRMNALARDHSEWMARRGKLSHRGSDGRFKDLQSSGVIGFAENVAYNLGHGDPAGTAVSGWIRSRGHHRNMTNSTYRLTGVGIARSKDSGWYFTQVFGRRQ